MLAAASLGGFRCLGCFASSAEAFWGFGSFGLFVAAEVLRFGLVAAVVEAVEAGSFVAGKVGLGAAIGVGSGEGASGAGAVVPIIFGWAVVVFSRAAVEARAVAVVGGGIGFARAEG